MVITTRIRKKTKIQKKTKKTKDNNELVDFKNQINQLIFCQCCKKKSKEKKRRQHRVNNNVDNNDSNNDDDCIFSFFFVLSPFYKNVGRFFFICDWLEFSFGFWFSDCFSPSLKNRCQKDRTYTVLLIYWLQENNCCFYSFPKFIQPTNDTIYF